jgi:molecular chaperone GrpE
MERDTSQTQAAAEQAAAPAGADAGGARPDGGGAAAGATGPAGAGAPVTEEEALAAEIEVESDEMKVEPAGAEPDTGVGDAASAAVQEPDYKDQYLRAMAEIDNVRKRARRDVGAAESRGIAKLARELLPALDNFARALDAAESQPENQDHHLTDGIRLVQTELLSALARVGIEPDSPKGETFDPHRHEALAQQPVEGAASGTIVEVYSQGYRFGEDVLRPAKVVVAA